MKKVDTEIRVVAFDTLADVLDSRDVERNGDAVNGHYDRLVLAICIRLK